MHSRCPLNRSRANVHDINRLGIYTDSWRAHTYNITIDSNVVHDCIHYGFCTASEKGFLLENITLINNIAYHNKHAGFVIGDWDGGKAHPQHHIYCINNTFYNNGWTAAEGGDDWGCGIEIMEPKGCQDIVIRNNIISDNLSATIIDMNGTAEIHIDHNLIDGYAGHPDENIGTDYVMGDPLFVDPGNNDLHIQSGSPAIDMGSSASAPDHDMDGDSRPDNGLWDMGADECVGGTPQPPVAEFSGNPLSGYAPLTVYFSDLSTGNPTSWRWTFGDGGTSGAQNPSHEYTTVDTYTVSLEACNGQGCDTETKVDYIDVQEQPSQSCHVGAIDMADGGTPSYKASATITVHDQDCQPLVGVTVDITWSGCVSGSDSGVTNDQGQVTFTSDRNKDGGTFTCCVDNLTKTGYPYASGDNHETCDEITLP